LLDQVAQAEDPITVEEVYDQLDQIFMENAVDIPMMYRPNEFYEFNTSHWIGFPTAEDPSAPPMFSGAGVELLYQISPGLYYLPVVNR
jgi:peptide/nickel transport system substrate-binding protein